jgi:Fic family protein
VKDAGLFRTQEVGIVKGKKVQHLAPPFSNVPGLMSDLFKYLNNPDELCLIKSCVFHYEMEFIHPFLDGNGRMGRLWQTLILKEEYTVFEFLPFETLISQTQDEYYKALSLSDKTGKSTVFIEYMLGVINESLENMLSFNNRTLTDIERIEYFIAQGKQKFGRKDYMDVFKNISSSTASRDLKKGIELNLIEKQGDKNKTVYIIKK